MEALINVLIATEEKLKLLNSPLVSFFLKGLTKKNIDTLLSNTDTKFSAKLYQLYGWKNGTDLDRAGNDIDLSIFPLATFLPLEKSLEYYEYYTKNSLWESQLFSLFASAGGDFFLVDLNAGSDTFEMIYFFCPSDPAFDGVVTFCDSLDSLFTSIVECYDQKGFEYEIIDGLKYLISNPVIEKLIFQSNNPNSHYWAHI